MGAAVRALILFVVLVLSGTGAQPAAAQPVSTGDAAGEVHSRLCPALKTSLGETGRDLLCTLSAGARQNIERALADPGHIAYVPRDLALGAIERNAPALREIGRTPARVCLFAAVADSDIFTYGDLLRAAQGRRVFVPAAVTGVAETFALLRRIDPNGVGRLSEAATADSADAAIAQAVSSAGIAVLAELESGAGELARRVAAGGARLVPLNPRPALGHLIGGEPAYEQADVRLGANPEPAICSPLVLITGDNARVAAGAVRDRHAQVVAAIQRAQQPAERMAAAPPPATSTRSMAPGSSTARSVTGGAPSATPRIGASENAQVPPTLPADGRPFTAIPIYFGTDRNRTSTPAGALTFGPDNADALSLGQAIVTIPKEHRVERGVSRPSWLDLLSLQNPFREDPARHFTLERLDVFSNEEQFLDAVAARMQAAREFKNQALVFVHGYRNTFDDALFRAAQLSFDTGFDGATFVYSWPSAGGIRYYVHDEENARLAEPHLEAFLDLVAEKSGAETVHVVAHSMGNQPLLRVMKRIAEKPGRKNNIRSIVLAAPDVSWREMQEAASSLARLAGVATLYASRNDRALQISSQLRRGLPRAGDVTNDGPVIVAGVDSIDVSATGTDIFALNHNGFAEARELVEDLKLILRNGKRMPERNERLLPAGADPKRYWRVPG
jgi:esterase/lipase superfamily enzyme